jgi:peptidoglycan/xylan/chitin deacetylase (PgdA/CDA1 family)
MLHTGGRVATTTRKAARLRRGVPVLMYHLVSDEVPPSFDGYTVTPSQFAAQVRALSRLGARSISPEELRVAHQEGRRLPRRSVVITFDDGFRDCLRHAAPVLQEAGFRATMYVVAGLLGKTSRWLRREGLEHLPLISSGEARELEQAGIDCQSHSFSHPRLAELSTTDITRELSLSRRVLEDELGHAVRHLAYPHGSHDARVRAEAAEAGYLTGFTTRPGKAVSYDDVLALPRVKVEGRRGSPDFLARLATGRDARYPLRLLTGRSEG